MERRLDNIFCNNNININNDNNNDNNNNNNNQIIIIMEGSEPVDNDKNKIKLIIIAQTEDRQKFGYADEAMCNARKHVYSYRVGRQTRTQENKQTTMMVEKRLIISYL